MSVRRVSRVAAVLFALAVLAALVVGAQRQATPPVEVAEPAAPPTVLPSTKLGIIRSEQLLELAPEASEGLGTQEVFLPSTKAAPVKIP